MVASVPVAKLRRKNQCETVTFKSRPVTRTACSLIMPAEVDYTHSHDLSLWTRTVTTIDSGTVKESQTAGKASEGG